MKGERIFVKKLILLVLTLSMLLTLMVGCKKPGDTTDTTETDTGSETSSSGNDTTPVGSDNDTMNAYDFEDATFTVLTRSDTKYEFKSDKGLGGDTVDRAVYKRNYNVEERFNANIEVVDKAGHWGVRNEFLSEVRAEAMGGNGGYDLVSTHSAYLGWMTVEGLAYDMATLPEINFAKAWWNQNLYDEINLNGKVYFMLGDICTTTYEYMQVMFFNEVLFANNFVDTTVDEIYQLVEDGEWTWDVLFSYSQNFGTEGEYGFLTSTHAFRAAFIAQDAYIYSRDADGKLILPDSPSDKLISVVEQMVLYYSSEKTRFETAGWDTGAAVLNPEFIGGRGLFYSQTLGEVEKFGSMKDGTYGVIPLPKYDTYQEKYYTICRDTVSAVMIITTTDTPEMSGVLTEALCMEGYNVVTPEYYGIVLKNRYFSDAKYAKILDMIRDGLTIQPVAMYIESSPTNDIFLEQVRLGTSNQVVSTYGNYVTAGQNKLNEFYSKMERDGLY